MTDLLNEANRQSGDWLSDVEKCPKRARPCGNPICADEAMRSGRVKKSNPHASAQAIKHAEDLADNCITHDCPLGKGPQRKELLNKLALINRSD